MPGSSCVNTLQLASIAPRRTLEECAATRKCKYDNFVQHHRNGLRCLSTPQCQHDPWMGWTTSDKCVQRQKEGVSNTKLFSNAKEKVSLCLSWVFKTFRARNVRAFSLFSQKYLDLLEAFHQTVEYEDHNALRPTGKGSTLY
ncbi:hypothetical protein K435DRAFT_834740 [Dendrothele bispora CBS 962.96]|uniref:Uncharacterized protein n=1 Tax=Dendrothele bispora (strain CBS 962.96) TaxID=1314807 RepID=A0A4S8MQL9_DENBC|nr:hypothetical protein K435DRAFT_834740 [Dendrothele bispora CBS 962.96]